MQHAKGSKGFQSPPPSRKLPPSKAFTSAALCKRSVSSLADKLNSNSASDRVAKAKSRMEHSAARRSKSTDPIADPYIPRHEAVRYRKCPPNCPCQLTHALPHIQHRGDPTETGVFYAEWMDAANRAKQRYITKVSERAENRGLSPPKSPQGGTEIAGFSPLFVSVKDGNGSARQLLPPPKRRNSQTESVPDTLGLAEPRPMPLPQLHGVHQLKDMWDPEDAEKESVFPVEHKDHGQDDSRPSEESSLEQSLSPNSSLSSGDGDSETFMPAPERRKSILQKTSDVVVDDALEVNGEAPPLPHLSPNARSSSSNDLKRSTLRSADTGKQPQAEKLRRIRITSVDVTNGSMQKNMFPSSPHSPPMRSPGLWGTSAHRKSSVESHSVSSSGGSGVGSIGKFNAASPFQLQRKSSFFFVGRKPKEHKAKNVKEKVADAPPLTAIGLEDEGKTLRMEGRDDLIRADKLNVMAQALATKRVRQLVLSRIALGQQGVDAMHGVFRSLPRLEQLVAEHNDLSAFGATSLGHALTPIRGLRVLELAGNAMGPKGLKALLHGVRHLSALAVLGLAGNRVGNEGLEHLAASFRASAHTDTGTSVAGDDHDKLPFGVSLTSLNLRDNGIGPDGCSVLFGSLVGLDLCTRIQRLDVSDNPITHSGSDFSGVAALRESLREMTSISSLNLGNTKLNTEGGLMVVEGLVHKEKAMQAQVRVFWRKIGVDPSMLLHERRQLEEQAQALEQAFRRYNLERPLKELNLGVNALGMEGMRAIGEAKGIFACLTSLDIGSNEMTGNAYNPTFDGTVRLTDALKTSKNLTFLNVSDNRISTESGDQSCLPTLCESLYLLQRLTYLDVSANNIGSSGAKLFAGSLASLRCLRYLDVSDNRLESKGMKDLVPALRGTLTDVNLSNNDIGPDGVTALTNQLPSLTSLTKLDLSRNRLSHAFSIVELAAPDGGAPDPDVLHPLKTPVLGGRPRKTIGFKDVASKMSISHGEVRKLALMANDVEGGLKRGFTAFAQACGIHLVSIASIVISVTIDAGAVRNNGPALNLSSGNYGQEDVIIIGELLKHNASLTAMDLSNNDLTQRGMDLRGVEVLSEWLQQADNIVQLDLSHVFLTDGGAERVGKGLLELKWLQTLKLKGNHLTSAGVMAMSTGAASLSSLTHLDISQNPLGALTDGKADRWDVAEGLQTFSMALKHCARLRMLDIRDCELGDEGGRAIALALSTLSELEHLYISGNHIQERGQEDIGQAIRKCSQVEITDDIQMPAPDARGRMVWSLAGQVKAVYQASLISNCIRRAQFVSLDLSRNQIGKNNGRMKDLAESFGCLTGLEDLDLSENGPFSVEVCQELAKSLQDMTTLRTLRLADNAIGGDGAAALMCTIVRLPNLKELDIHNNRFKFFPVALPASCPELLRLEVSGNPWLCPSQRVMSRNSFQIREHLSSLFQEGSRDRDLVLALVGSQLVGKSSLLRALTSSSSTARHIAVRDRTKGLAFKSWQPAGPSGPNFTVFDFAGMHMYRDIQCQLFLPRRALYCLVWRPFAPHAGIESNAHYRVRSRGSLQRSELRVLLADQVVGWLAILYQRVPGCSVMLVGTHGDEMMPEEELTWQSTQIENAARAKLHALKQELPHLQPVSLLLGPTGSIPIVSCRTGSGVAELRAHITASATTLPFFGEFLPRSWTLVRELFLPPERKDEGDAPGGKRDSASHASVPQARQRHGSLLSESEFPPAVGRQRRGSLRSEADGPMPPVANQQRRRQLSIQSQSEIPVSGQQTDEPILGVSPTGSALEMTLDLGQQQQEYSLLSQDSQQRQVNESSYQSQPSDTAARVSSAAAPASKSGRGCKSQRAGTMGGYLWVGHFKRLAKQCGVEDCQIMELLRYLHDSGLVRFFAFDEGAESWRRGNGNFEGFEELEPYRSAGFKIATNSRQALMDKNPPPGTRDQAWGNVLDTVVVDVPWLSDVVCQVVDASPREALRVVRDKQGGLEVEASELEEAALALHKESSLRWSKAGGYSILRELWAGSMPDHDMRRIRNLLEGRHVLRFLGGRMTVPALRKREGTPSSAGQTPVFVSADRNPSVVNNKEQNMARPWSVLLTSMLQDIMGLQVRSAARMENEDMARDAVSSCGVFVMVVTDSYFRSRTCTTELSLALELAMPVIPLILPQYSLWPPAIKDGCWWEDHGIAHIDNLHLADPIDLSLEHFRRLLEPLLQTSPAVESRRGSIAGSTASDDAFEGRWSLMEDASSVRWGLMDSGGLDGPTPPATAASTGGRVAEPVPHVREVLGELRQRAQTALEEEGAGASEGAGEGDEGEAAAAETELESAYAELCAAVEGALHDINAAAHQATWFPIASEPDEVGLHYEKAVAVLKTFQTAQFRAKERAREIKEDRESRARDRRERAEDAKRQAIEEVEATRVNAELWQRDPLHAKIAILHDVANIHRGLGVEPRWYDKDQIVARAQHIARHPSMQDMRAKSEAGKLDAVGSQRWHHGTSWGELAEANEEEFSPLVVSQDGARSEEGAYAGHMEGAREAASEEESTEEHLVKEPLFDLMFGAARLSPEAAVNQEADAEEELDLTLTLGLEQQLGEQDSSPEKSAVDSRA